MSSRTVNLVADGVVQGAAKVNSLLVGDGTAQTLTAAQTGTTFMLPQATAATVITLPAVSAGLNYKFIMTAVGDATAGHRYDISTPAAATLLRGFIMTVAAAAVFTNFTGKTRISNTGVAADSLIGDYLELTCDGTNWYARAFSSGAAAGWGTN